MTGPVKPLLGPRSAGLVGVLLVLVAVVAGITAVVVAGWAVARPDADIGVTLTHTRAALEAVPLPPAASFSGDNPVLGLHVRDVPLGLRALALAGTVLLALSVAAGALALAQVLRTIRAGRPFAARNATWWAVVAAAVLVGGGLVPLVDDIAALAVLDRLGLTEAGTPFEVGVTVPLLPFLVTALVLAVAEAFRRGAALTADVEGLV